MQLGTRGFVWSLVALGLILAAGTAFYAVRAAERIPVAPVWTVAGGDPESGRAALVRYGCGACHTVRGVPGARGRVAPALTDVAAQSYLAGRLSNTPDNLVRWIQAPQAFVPGTAMPNLGVTESEARDIAAYLYGLGR